MDRISVKLRNGYIFVDAWSQTSSDAELKAFYGYGKIFFAAAEKSNTVFFSVKAAGKRHILPFLSYVCDSWPFMPEPKKENGCYTVVFTFNGEIAMERIITKSKSKALCEMLMRCYTASLESSAAERIAMACEAEKELTSEEFMLLLTCSNQRSVT